MKTLSSQHQALLLHVDCDNFWCYEDEYGFGASGNHDHIYDQALSEFLALAFKHNVRFTFFIVGSDLTLPSCRQFCRAALKSGHAIANHSFSHTTDFGKLSKDGLKDEVWQAHIAIEEHLGVKPIGFRAPGFFLNNTIIEILTEFGYRYDGSIIPGAYQLVFSAYKVFNSFSNTKSIGRKKYLFASRSITSATATAKNSKPLYLLPVSTWPFVKLPFHSTVAFMLGERFLKFSLWLIENEKNTNTYLFHAIDLVDNPPTNGIHNLPTFRRSFKDRKRLVETILVSAKKRRRALSEDLIVELDSMDIEMNKLIAR